MLFSNELNYWVIKKYAKKDLLLRMGRHIRTCPKTSDVGTPTRVFQRYNSLEIHKSPICRNFLALLRTYKMIVLISFQVFG
ncbi:hypothetical protein IQA64_16925 [Leptospira borgpetersenii serovar Tarassovi]|nr:hypothetical protein [Leptospira borgpetersenii serovar Tarassovi]